MPISVSTGDPNARAANAAQLRYGGQEDAIARAVASLNVSRQADQAALDQYGVGGRGAINATFDDLASNLGINRAQTAQDLGTQANLVGQGYRDAQAIAEAARAQGAANLQSLFNSNVSYQGGSLAEAQSPIESLAAKIIGSQAQNDATVTGNLRNWAAQQDALLGAGISGAQRDRSNRLSGFESELLRALAESRNAATNEEYDLQAQLLDLLNERGAFTADAAANFADTAFGQQLQAAQYNLSEQAQMAEAAARAASMSQAATESDWRRALAEREQSFQETQASKEDPWKALQYDLAKRGVALDERSFLSSEENRRNETAMALTEFLANSGVIGGDDQQSILDFMASQGLFGAPGSGAIGGSGVGGVGNTGGSIAPKSLGLPPGTRLVPQVRERPAMRDFLSPGNTVPRGAIA